MPHRSSVMDYLNPNDINSATGAGNRNAIHNSFWNDSKKSRFQGTVPNAKAKVSHFGNSAGLNKWGVGGAAIDTYINLRAGDSVPVSVAKGIGTGIVFSIAPYTMLGATAAMGVGSGATAAHRMKKEKVDQWNMQANRSGIVGGNYQDTQRAQTMRQAAVQQIQGNKLNARSALGGEAKILAGHTHY